MTPSPETVEVLLTDGSALHLEYSPNAMCDFERAMNADGFDPLVQLDQLVAGRATVSALRAMIWACARLRHPGLTLQHVGNLMQRDGHALRDGLARALDDGRPVPDADSGDAAGKPTPPSD